MNTKNTVIVAEDSPRDREFLANSITCFDLIFANDGEQAVKCLKETQARYIISDIQMPNMNGIELAHSIWEISPDARIVFWSHYKDEIYLRSLSRIIPPDTVYGYINRKSVV